MRLFSRSFSVSSVLLIGALLIASACLQADTPPAEQPWPESLIKRLPAAFQDAARKHAEAPATELARLATIDDRSLFYTATDDIAETDAGVLALMDVMRTAPSLESRLDVAVKF